MSDASHTLLGIAVNRVTVVSILPRHGFVSLCTRRLPQPLGRAAWLHVVERLILAGLKAWPEAASVVTAIALTAAVERAGAPARETEMAA